MDLFQTDVSTNITIHYGINTELNYCKQMTLSSVELLIAQLDFISDEHCNTDTVIEQK